MAIRGGEYACAGITAAGDLSDTEQVLSQLHDLAMPNSAKIECPLSAGKLHCTNILEWARFTEAIGTKLSWKRLIFEYKGVIFVIAIAVISVTYLVFITVCSTPASRPEKHSLT